MPMFTLGGSTQRTQDFLSTMQDPNKLYADLITLAQRGVDALTIATPKDSGYTAASWGYEIEISDSGCKIFWVNTHLGDDGKTHVAILLQYGHGTGTGGYVQGEDYINPALKPIFDQIADTVWEKVSSA